jgi:hypothetical protein
VARCEMKLSTLNNHNRSVPSKLFIHHLLRSPLHSPSLSPHHPTHSSHQLPPSHSLYIHRKIHQTPNRNERCTVKPVVISAAPAVVQSRAVCLQVAVRLVVSILLTVVAGYSVSGELQSSKRCGDVFGGGSFWFRFWWG